MLRTPKDPNFQENLTMICDVGRHTLNQTRTLPYLQMHPFSLIFHWDTTKDDEEMGQSLGHWQWAESLEVQIQFPLKIPTPSANQTWQSSVNAGFPLLMMPFPIFA